MHFLSIPDDALLCIMTCLTGHHVAQLRLVCMHLKRIIDSPRFAAILPKVSYETISWFGSGPNPLSVSFDRLPCERVLTRFELASIPQFVTVHSESSARRCVRIRNPSHPSQSGCTVLDKQEGPSRERYISPRLCRLHEKMGADWRLRLPQLLRHVDGRRMSITGLRDQDLNILLRHLGEACTSTRELRLETCDFNQVNASVFARFLDCRRNLQEVCIRDCDGLESVITPDRLLGLTLDKCQSLLPTFRIRHHKPEGQVSIWTARLVDVVLCRAASGGLWCVHLDGVEPSWSSLDRCIGQWLREASHRRPLTLIKMDRLTRGVLLRTLRHIKTNALAADPQVTVRRLPLLERSFDGVFRPSRSHVRLALEQKYEVPAGPNPRLIFHLHVNV